MQKELDNITSETQASVRVVHCPIILTQSGIEYFYDLSTHLTQPSEQAAIDAGSQKQTTIKYDMLILDGPSDLSLRHHALQFLDTWLDKNVIVVVDDADRNEIKRALPEWKKSEYVSRYFKTIKGTLVLWRQQRENIISLP